MKYSNFRIVLVFNSTEYFWGVLGTRALVLVLVLVLLEDGKTGQCENSPRSQIGFVVLEERPQEGNHPHHTQKFRTCSLPTR